MQDRILGEEVGRQRALDIDAQGRLHSQALQLENGRHAMPHVHLDREGDRNLHAFVVHRLPSKVGHPGHVDKQVVGPEPDVLIDAALAHSELVQDRTDAERGEDVRRNLQTELAPDRPGLRVGRRPEVDLTAHDHRDELVGRGEVLLFDAGRVLGISIVGAVAPGALEIAERRSAPLINQGLDGSVGVLRRVVDLRDVVHGRHTVVELAQRPEQLVDVHVLRPVHRREAEKDVFVVSRGPGRCARAVIDQDPIGQKAAQRPICRQTAIVIGRHRRAPAFAAVEPRTDLAAFGGKADRRCELRTDLDLEGRRRQQDSVVCCVV
jgi:hypothetical protein